MSTITLISSPVSSVASSSVPGSSGTTDPRFTSQPVDATVSIGEDAVFSETHEGTEPIVGVWQELKV
jgi:hypothetical protein